MTCKSCLNWREFEHGERPRGWGSCALGETVSGEAKNPHSLAVALDAEIYAAELRTSPNFGCIQHRPL